MNLLQYKGLIFAVTSVVALIVASPALQRLLVSSQTESFTELWIIGPEHMAENYPYNVTSGRRYNVFLGVSNHLGRAAYYSLQVKFRNLTQSAPSSLNRIPSSLPILYSVNVFVGDKESWETPLDFGFEYVYEPSFSRISFSRLLFNNADLNLGGYSTTWDLNSTSFFGDLVFELWIHNDAVGGLVYHERYVDLKFNMTV